MHTITLAINARRANPDSGLLIAGIIGTGIAALAALIIFQAISGLLLSAGADAATCVQQPFAYTQTLSANADACGAQMKNANDTYLSTTTWGRYSDDAVASVPTSSDSDGAAVSLPTDPQGYGEAAQDSGAGR